jgi:hypothetical protein
MRDSTRILMDERDWWRRVEAGTHHALTDAAHELSDETARTMQYLALLCGALARDAGWGEDEVKVLATTVRERLAYDHGIVTDHVAALLLTGYRGIGDGADRA